MKGFKGKLTVSALLTAFLTAGVVGSSQSNMPATGNLSATFRQAVADTYALSCAARDARRAGNIRAPTQLSTPSYFRRNGTDLALYSPHLSPASRREAEAVFNSMPRHVMDLFYTLGGVSLFTERSLVEALPDSAREKKDNRYPYYNVYVGLYRNHEKRAFVTFKIAEIAERNGVPQVTGYKPVLDKRTRVFHHEIGHFINDVIGELGSPFFEFGAYRFSDRAEFIARLRQDLDALAVANRTQAELKWRSYFLPKNHNGVSLFGSKDDLGDIGSEVFAELWAETQGHGVFNLKSFFPRTYALVEALNEDLKYLHANRGPSCRYDGYNPARP